MDCLTKFLIIFAHFKIETASAKVVENFVRQALFLELIVIIVIFSINNNPFGYV